MKASTSPEQELSNAWDSYLSTICSNIRQLGLLLNDFSVAAPMIAGEVNREDLIKIIAVQRFNPELYKAIYDHADFVTYAQIWFKNPVYIREEKQKKLNEEAYAAITKALENSSSPEAYRELLFSLFPVLKERLASDSATRRVHYDYQSERSEARRERRIAHPDYFPAYFRYQVPDSIVGSREFSGVMLGICNAGDEDGVYRVLSDFILRMPIGAVKRYDFMERLSTEEPDRAVSERICFALARLSNEFQYDLVDIGEAALALDFVSNAAKRVPQEHRSRLLKEILRRTSDDTFALRIVDRSSPREDGRPALIPLEIEDQAIILVAFRKRMVDRYGHKLSVRRVAIETSDPQAFWKWARMSSNDAAIVRRFWRRFVDRDKRVLAQVVNIFFLRFAWSTDPKPFVELIFTERFLRNALATFREGTEPLPDFYEDAMRWIEAYLAGRFGGGVSPFWREGFPGSRNRGTDE